MEDPLTYQDYCREQAMSLPIGLSPGQKVTWEAFGCRELDLVLTDVFEERRLTSNKATAKVKSRVPLGPYDYAAICDGQAAEGNSAPGVIIDR